MRPFHHPPPGPNGLSFLPFLLGLYFRNAVIRSDASGVSGSEKHTTEKYTIVQGWLQGPLDGGAAT
jgi:hypothetical protein